MVAENGYSATVNKRRTERGAALQSGPRAAASRTEGRPAGGAGPG